MNIDDTTAIDEVLATTRAVRRRLDLTRPVDNELILDCIDLAEQAPTGGNLGSRRWTVVRDQEVKDRIGELYRRIALPFMSSAAARLHGTGHPQEKVMASSTFLAEHLAEVPALVVLSIIGRHDGSGRPGLFDSVIQAGWSFALALRARGLGSTWVTAALSDEPAIKEILGLPDDTTEVVLFPVAWTKGTDFRPARRHPAREITYFDRYGSTYASGPDDAPSFAAGPGTVVEVDIAARADRVWDLVSDIDLPARFSDEFLGADWRDDTRGLGAVFIGRNRRADLGEWTMPCQIDTYDEGSAFGWRTVSWQPGAEPAGFERPGARWRFTLEPTAGRTRLRFGYTMGPGDSGASLAIRRWPDKEARIITKRIAEVRANMQRTVDGIKALAEGAG